MKKNIIESASVVAAITLMVLASELLGEREIIFPEIAALSIGCFLPQRLAWKTDYLRMIACIEICAILGVCIVCFVPLPLRLQIALAFAVGQIVFMFSQTSLAPMISAIVLPVMLQTRGFVYPLAALILTAYIAAKRIVLEKYSVKEHNDYQAVKKPQKADWLAFIYRTALVFALSYACVRINSKFSIAPPLLVAFTELCRPDCPAGKRKVQAVLLITLCALVGAGARLVLVMKLGLAYTAAAIVIGILIVVLLRAFKLYFPPAGAMAVLALLIPDEAVLMYPIEVCGGIVLLTLCAELWIKTGMSRA